MNQYSSSDHQARKVCVLIWNRKEEINKIVISVIYNVGTRLSVAVGKGCLDGANCQGYPLT